MLAIFPGFLFRKCYYSGEFTKQFNQSNEFDKLLWNVFFSGVSMAITFMSIYAFKDISGLTVLDSLNYDKVRNITTTISKNELPERKILNDTYKDLILIIGLVYFFSCFFGVMSHWLVRSLKLDLYIRVLRFKNYWYYYIHGGKILYSNPSKRKFAFTKVDVLCEIAGETKLYSGILSQYTVNESDNNLENLFLTDARVLKQIKDDAGNTTEVVHRVIPGAAFCIPYKNVVNMNLVYFYRDNGRSIIRFLIILNLLSFLCFTFIIISVFWFDLTAFGIDGFWRKTLYVFAGFIGIANLRLLIYDKNRKKLEWVAQALLVLSSLLWLLYCIQFLPMWIAIACFTAAVIASALISPTNSDPAADDSIEANSDNNLF